jgi:hypothetical protein
MLSVFDLTARDRNVRNGERISNVSSWPVAVAKPVSYETGRKLAPMLALACFISLFHIGQTVSKYLMFTDTKSLTTWR